MTNTKAVKRIAVEALGLGYRKLLPQFELKNRDIQEVTRNMGGIPRTLFRTWKTRKFDFLHYRTIRSLERANPHWQYLLFDDRDVTLFMNQVDVYPAIVEIFQATRIPSARADIWRYLVILESGGGYLDIDSSIECSLDSLIQDESEAFSLEQNRLKDIVISDSPLSNFFRNNAAEIKKIGWNPDAIVLNWSFFAKPNHPILRLAIQSIIENHEYFLDRQFENVHSAIVNFSGPILLTQAVWKYLLGGGRVNVCGRDFDGKATFKSVPRLSNYRQSPHSTDLKNAIILQSK